MLFSKPRKVFQVMEDGEKSRLFLEDHTRRIWTAALDKQHSNAEMQAAKATEKNKGTKQTLFA